MAADPLLSAPPALPAGYLPVPLPGMKAAALRINLIARKDADAVAGYFVVLRTLLDGVVYLGCITDAGNHLHGYVEIWMQNLEGLADSPAAAREALSNQILDERWVRLYKAWDVLDDASAGTLYRTGNETVHPLPMFYDTDKRELVQPADAFSNGVWTLCMDEAVLAAKGLPGYANSLHRYLYVPTDGKPPLIPVTGGAPMNASTATLSEITGPNQTLRPVGTGGLMLVRSYAPAKLEAFLDLLSGGGWEGILSGRSAVHLDRLNESLEEKDGSPTGMVDGRLFLGKHGKWGRLIETFHLKLRLLADCIAGVRELTAHTQRPLLNISANSFQVRIGAVGRALPFLWTATAELVDPSDAVTLKMESSEAQYFMRGLSAPGNVYQPESVSKPASGRGILRIRKIMAESAGAIIEGTFSTQERLGDASGPAKNDLVWLRAPVGSQRVDLYGHVDKDAALAAGEWRFRTERQKLPESVIGLIKAGEGVPIPETIFDVVPLLSSPCDLYALAILGARALLVNGETTLAIVADELLSLARQVASQHHANVSLIERIHAIFEADSRWVASLGPQRLSRETMTPQEAFDLVPAELWFETLGMLVRMLPAIGPDSICRDFGDAPRGGMQKIFDLTIENLSVLLVRSRSLIVIDWRFNREIHAVLRRFPAGGAAK